MPGANYFILVLITAIIYNLTYIGELTAGNLSAALFWFNLEHMVIPLQHYLWLMMGLEYVRLQKKYLKPAKYVLFYHPVLYYIIFYTNHLHHLYISSYRFVSNGYFPVIVSDKGPLFMMVVASGTLLGVIATTAYIWGYLKAPRLQRYGYLIMIFASLFPWVSVYLNAANISYLGIDYFPVVSIISGVFYIFGIFHFRVFHAFPIATEMVFRQSKDGILLIDLTDHIIDVNSAFLNLYPGLSSLSNQHTFGSFIQANPELNGLTGHIRVQFQRVIEGKMSFFAAEIIPILTEDDLPIGKLLKVNDVTLFVEHQKRLESIASQAINQAETNEISFLQAQINPHFLNNTLSVIASMITRSPHEARNLIADLGEYLTNCYYFDSSSAMVSLEEELETVKTYVAIEKARFRERLHYRLVGGDVPPIRIPRLILQPLVENAIRHGILKKVEGGQVWLIISCESNKVIFEIKDDGIGIPAEKISSLIMDEGQRRGIGILNIHKRLLKYYGAGLTITSTAGQGTSVKFSASYEITD